VLPDQVITLQVSTGTVPSPPGAPTGPPPLAGGFPGAGG
jgi:hypothetical protein